MTAGLTFLEGCALQLPDNFLQLKNSLLIEIMQQLNQLGILMRLDLSLTVFQLANHDLLLTIKPYRCTILSVENNLKR